MQTLDNIFGCFPALQPRSPLVGIGTREARRVLGRKDGLPNERNDPGWTTEAGVEEARTHNAVRSDKSVKHLFCDAQWEALHIQVSRCPIAKLLHLRLEGVRRNGIRTERRGYRGVSRTRNLVNLLEILTSDKVNHGTRHAHLRK